MTVIVKDQYSEKVELELERPITAIEAIKNLADQLPKPNDLPTTKPKPLK